jgi:hypothetical protein
MVLLTARHSAMALLQQQRQNAARLTKIVGMLMNIQKSR